MPSSSSLLTLMLQQEAHSGAAPFPVSYSSSLIEPPSLPSCTVDIYTADHLRLMHISRVQSRPPVSLACIDCCILTVFLYSTALILASLGLYGRCLARPLHLSFHVLTARGNMLPCPPFQCCLLRETPLSAPLALHGGLTVH